MVLQMPLCVSTEMAVTPYRSFTPLVWREQTQPKNWPKKTNFQGWPPSRFFLCLSVSRYKFMCTAYIREAAEAGGECWIPWSWRFRQVWAIRWGLGTELQFSWRAASSHNLRAISPAPRGKVSEGSAAVSPSHACLLTWGYFVLPRITFDDSYHESHTEPHCKAYCCYKFTVAIQWCIPPPTFFMGIQFLSRAPHLNIQLPMGYLKLDSLT